MHEVMGLQIRNNDRTQIFQGKSSYLFEKCLKSPNILFYIYIYQEKLLVSAENDLNWTTNVCLQYKLHAWKNSCSQDVIRYPIDQLSCRTLLKTIC